MQPEMLFRLGSTTKMFTAAALLTLAENNKIKMNEPIKDGKLYMKFDGQESAMTKSGERKFTFGAQNENEVVFVPGKDGKIRFLFTELYGAKKIR
jgi:hypothetical protein